MNDTKSLLAENVTLAVVGKKQSMVFTFRGIKPLLFAVKNRAEMLDGADVADIVVGKAAALLMAKGKVKSVYGKVMSSGAITVFERYGIAYEYGSKAATIVNRKGDGPCPMEQTVADIEDPEEAYAAVMKKFEEITGEKI